MLIGLAIFPIGAALIFSAATAAAMHDVADEQRGIAGGVLNAAMEGGPTVGFALLVSLAGARTAALADHGALYPAATTAGYGFAFSAAAAVYLAAIALALFTLRPRSTNQADSGR